LRLCQLKRWTHFDGYGFTLHISQAASGQFIVGHVETESPAAAAGLLPGDHLIQVARSLLLLLYTRPMPEIVSHRLYYAVALDVYSK